MKPIVDAAGIVMLVQAPHQQVQSVLLLKHKQRWDLPKGHLESGETLQQAALRETEEETGIPAGKIQLDSEFRFLIEYQVESKKRGNHHKRVTYFLGFVDRRWPVTLTEHIGYEWVDWPLGPIQAETIDPLLSNVRRYLDGSDGISR